MDLLKEKYGWGNAPDETAGPYILKCRKFVENDEAFSNFRRDFDYGKILSGDPKIVGDIAIDSIKKFNQFNFLLDNLDEIKKNDKVGNPYLYEYDQLGEINPSTLKYFNTIVEIKPLIGDYVTKKIVEIGGGYGGLCRIFDAFYDFEEYIIIDLPDAIKLAEKYLNYFPKLNGKVKYISCEEFSNYDSIENVDLFIADSSIAECNLQTQNLYRDKIAKNSKHIYVAWNTHHLPNGNSEKLNFIDGFGDDFLYQDILLDGSVHIIYIKKENVN